jgi:hypothetical protein
LKSRRKLRRENRDLRAEVALRKKREAIQAERHDRTTQDLTTLRELYDNVVRTAGAMDSAEVAALKKIITGLEGENRALTRRLADTPTVAALREQIAERDITLRGLAEELDTTKAALARASEPAEWDPSRGDAAKAWRDEHRARVALTERLALMQRASEARDPHRNDHPWTPAPAATS